MYRSGASLPRYRRDLLCRPLYVANGTLDTPSGAPLHSEAADRIKANWLPLMPGQAVPLIGEVRGDRCDEPCDY